MDTSTLRDGSSWPTEPFHICLVEPDIPPNTGAVARLCAATGSILHLVEPLGFKITSASVKRAGLDYWDSVDIRRHKNFKSFLESINPNRIFLLSTKGKKKYSKENFKPGDALVFGSETRGLSADIMQTWEDSLLTIPMRRDHVRSLNLATSVAIVLYEALRQIHDATE